MSFPVCKFYSTNNKCKFGEDCRYLHSVNQKPPPYISPGRDHGKAVSASDQSSVIEPSSDLSIQSPIHNHENPVICSSLNPSAPTFHSSSENRGENNAAVKGQRSHQQTGTHPPQKICQYYAQHGTCAFGRNCRFSHIIQDVTPGSCQPNESHQRSRDVPPRFQRQNKEKKSSTASGSANTNDDLKSDDLNNPQSSDLSNPNCKKRKNRQCYLFKSGRCRWGKQCRFSHSQNSSGRTITHFEDEGRDTEPSAQEEKESESALPAEQENSHSRRPQGNYPSRPVALKQVLTIQELEEDGNECYRQLDINYLKRRFPKSCSLVIEDKDNFIFQAKFSPSDPDWSFDITVFHLEFLLPKLYPKEALIIKVLGEDNFPETVRRYLEVSISEWLVDRNDSFAAQGNVELSARPFLRWLDRKIEDMTTEALLQLKRELIAKAAGLEFIPAEKLQARYTSESGSAENEGSVGDEEEDASDDKTEESEDDSYSYSSGDSAEEDDEEKGPSLNLDPERRGTEIALRNLQLKEKATSLLFDRIKLILLCSRCKTHEELVIMPGKVFSLTCGKCSHEMLATFRPSLAHQFSSIIGYLDLENCTAFDLIFQECKTSVTCLNCSKQTKVDGLVSGQLVNGWCQACNAQFKIATDAVKFSQLAPSGIDVSGNKKMEIVSKKSKKPPKDPNIKEGCPLPEFGTCKHYKHSYRWLRFPCCGKAYPCDVCHDKNEDHEMVFANRMICGHCCKEQTFSATRPCNACGSGLIKTRTAHWEGGSGCRDKIAMSKSDIQKYKNMNKTISNHKKKVQSTGSKKKTTKLRHV